jgi:hypothetical protein
MDESSLSDPLSEELLTDLKGGMDECSLSDPLSEELLTDIKGGMSESVREDISSGSEAEGSETIFHISRSSSYSLI